MSSPTQYSTPPIVAPEQLFDLDGVVVFGANRSSFPTYELGEGGARLALASGVWPTDGTPAGTLLAAAW